MQRKIGFFLIVCSLLLVSAQYTVSALDVNINEHEASTPLETVRTEQEGQTVASQTNPVDVQIHLPQAIHVNEASLSYREQGSSIWKHIGAITEEALPYVSLKLHRDVSYEYRLNFFNKNKYYKIIGTTLKINTENNAVLEDAENIVQVKSFDSNKLDLELKGFPQKHVYGTGNLMVAINGGTTAINLFKIYDADGSRIPVKPSRFLNLALPIYTDSIQNTLSYETSSPGFEDIYGEFRFRMGELSFLETVHHTAEFTKPFSIKIDMLPKETNYVLQFDDLVSGTEINIDNSHPDLKFEVKGNAIEFVLGPWDTVPFNILLEKDGMVPVHIAVNLSQDGTLAIMNIDEVEKASMDYDFNSAERRLSFKQKPYFSVISDDTLSPRAISLSMNDFIQSYGTVRPGTVQQGGLRIENTTSESYQIIGFDILPQETKYEQAQILRTDVPAVMTYYDNHKPVYNVQVGSARHLIDFESINQVGFYDALLSVYQLDNSDLTSLESLSSDELQKIFGAPFQFFEDKWEGNPNADYAYPISNNSFGILESDHKMIDLALHHLFENSLYITMDESLTGALKSTASNNDSALRYSSYSN